MQDDIASARKHGRRIVGREIAGSRDDADVGESELVAVLYGVFFGRGHVRQPFRGLGESVFSSHQVHFSFRRSSIKRSSIKRRPFRHRVQVMVRGLLHSPGLAATTLRKLGDRSMHLGQTPVKAPNWDGQPIKYPSLRKEIRPSTGSPLSPSPSPRRRNTKPASPFGRTDPGPWSATAHPCR